MIYSSWYAIKLNHQPTNIEELALNNLQFLICHKTQLNQILYI